MEEQDWPSVDPSERVRLTLAYPEAPQSLRSSELARVVGSIVYLHDLAAISAGEPWYPPYSGSTFYAGPEPVPTTSRPSEINFPGTEHHEGEFPGFRPRFRPRLVRGGAELHIEKLGFGSPLVLDLLVGTLRIAGTFTGLVLSAEKLATLPSRVRADRAENKAREVRARLEEATSRDALDERALRSATRVRTEVEELLGPAEVQEIEALGNDDAS